MSEPFLTPDTDCPCGSGNTFENCCDGREDTEAMIETWIKRGKKFERSNDTAACDVWLCAWEVVRSELDEDATSRRYVDEHVFDFDFHFFNWIPDLRIALYRASREDAAYAEPGVSFAREVLEQFPEENASFRKNQKMDLARLQKLAGRFERAVKTAESIIKEFPEAATGYATLGDLYQSRDEPDYERAIEAYRNGLENVSEEEARSYDLENRVKEARENM